MCIGKIYSAAYVIINTVYSTQAYLSYAPHNGHKVYKSANNALLASYANLLMRNHKKNHAES